MAAQRFAYAISGLIPGLQYAVRITAKNSRGFGVSSPAEFETPRAPPTAVRDVQVRPRDASADGLEVRWSEPAAPNGAPITEYRVEYDSTSFNFDQAERAVALVEAAELQAQ